MNAEAGLYLAPRPEGSCTYPRLASISQCCPLPEIITASGNHHCGFGGAGVGMGGAPGAVLGNSDH